MKELTEEVNKLKEQVKAAEDAKSELEAQNNKVFIIILIKCKYIWSSKQQGFYLNRKKISIQDLTLFRC